MNADRTRLPKLAILLLLLCWFGFTVIKQYRANNAAGKYLVPTYPAQGFPLNDTDGLVPGNPSKAISDLKQIHKMLGIYRSSHNNEMPSDSLGLFQDVMEHPNQYGFKTAAEAQPVFVNPDSKYADNLPGAIDRSDTSSFIPYTVLNTRPDGSKVGEQKPEGTRDLIALTSLYFHEDIRHFNHKRQSDNPVGFYICLWDDGTVQKIPYDKRLYVEDARHNYQLGFPGQAGLTAKTITYDQFYQQAGYKEGPRGKAHGKGIFNDQP